MSLTIPQKLEIAEILRQTQDFKLIKYTNNEVL